MWFRNCEVDTDVEVYKFPISDGGFEMAVIALRFCCSWNVKILYLMVLDFEDKF